MIAVDIKRLKMDAQYYFLNSFVNKIPIWTVRSLIYRLFGMKIGKSARIGTGSIVYFPDNIILGDRVVINENCYLDGRFGLIINHDVGVSNNVKIITATHIPDSDSFEYFGEKVVIRHHSWVASNAIVLPGSHIAEYTVIGAGAVYKGRTKAGDIIIGNPGKIIKSRATRANYTLNYAPYFR